MKQDKSLLLPALITASSWIVGALTLLRPLLIILPNSIWTLAPLAVLIILVLFSEKARLKTLRVVFWLSIPNIALGGGIIGNWVAKNKWGSALGVIISLYAGVSILKQTAKTERRGGE